MNAVSAFRRHDETITDAIRRVEKRGTSGSGKRLAPRSVRTGQRNSLPHPRVRCGDGRRDDGTPIIRARTESAYGGLMLTKIR